MTIQALEKIGAGDDLFMYRLLKNYLTDTAIMVKKISDLALQGDYMALQEVCHALKGNSLSIGAMQMTSSANKLSDITNAVSNDDISQLLDDLQQHFTTLTTRIEGYLKHPEIAFNK